MTEILTEELLDDLLSAPTLEPYLDKSKNISSRTLSEYLNDLLNQKSLKKSEVIKHSGLNTTFAYQIFSGDRKASRNKLLQLSFAIKLTLRETQRLLKAGGVNELYCKNRRDAIIIYCINRQMSLEETENILYEFHEATICQEE